MIWKIVFWLFVMPFIFLFRVTQIVVYKYLTWRGYEYKKNEKGFYQWSNKKVKYSEGFNPKRV